MKTFIIYRGENEKNISKIFGNSNSGLFFSPSIKGAKGWGKPEAYLVKDSTKIFNANKSSDGFCFDNNLYNKVSKNIINIINSFTDKLSINKLTDFTKLSATEQNLLDKAITDKLGSNFCWYDAWDWASQAIAKEFLSEHGYAGVKWQNQDFGNPVQYQIWDLDILEKL